MRSSILYAMGFTALAAATAEPDAEYSTTITIRVTSTITSYIATETVTGTPPAHANQTPSVLSFVTMPASTMPANATATGSPSTGFSNSASPLLRSRELVLAGALSALTMVLAAL